MSITMTATQAASAGLIGAGIGLLVLGVAVCAGLLIVRNRGEK